MRTLVMMVIGVALAFAFDAVAAALNKRGGARALDGGLLFIWIWAGIMLADLYVGISAGNTVALELGVHALLFAIPGGVGWFLSRRRKAPPDMPE